MEPVYDREELIVADLNLSEIDQEFLTLDVSGHYSGPTCSHSKRKRNKFAETQLFGTNEPVATGGSVTYSGGLNLIHMGRNIFLLVLALAFMIAAGRAQTKPNHLSGQTSPYLKRAVSQPVDWYPWGPESFKRAGELNRPILLDVGAVWCPWCSLMDRDTYTNVATADYINQHFVAVKVDFDSAPELVAQLQRAQAVLNLPAGLPLTSFITPDGKLYFGAGYLAAEHKGDKPSFREAAGEALKRYTDKSKIDEESFQLEIAKKP